MIYGRALGRSLKRTLARHSATIERLSQGNLDLQFVFGAGTVREFDERLTRRVFGYRSVDDYYRDGSSAQRLRGVAVPLLCLSVRSRPFFRVSAVGLTSAPP